MHAATATACAGGCAAGGAGVQVSDALAQQREFMDACTPASGVEAHAVLAPALEGFMPTLEMPEIAKARSARGAWRDGRGQGLVAHGQRRLDLQTLYGQPC